MTEETPSYSVTYYKWKRVNGRLYLYEMESFRDGDGLPSNRIVRYLGPASPVYGRAAARVPSKPAADGDGRGRSPDDRRREREIAREDDRVRRWLDKNRW